MKIYDEHQVLQEVICNRCEKKLFVENGLLKDSVYEGRQTFGYFSERDGVTHRFDLCEECYNEWIHMFRIPVLETENPEII